MKTLAAAIIALACTASAHALAQDNGLDLPVDSRIKLLMYDESDIYTLVTKYGYQTNVVFGPGEEVQTISMGDRSLWQIIPSGNRLFIRPMEEDVTTNMTVLTDRRSYQFDLRSVGKESAATIVYVAKFVYPGAMRADATFMAAPAMPVATMMQPPPRAVMSGPPPAETVPPPQPVASAPMPAPGQPNYNYTFSGPDGLAPAQVYDDGKSTYITYADMKKPLPDAYAVDAKGKETPIAYRVSDGKMVIGKVLGEMVLRHAGGDIVVYNETLNPR